MDPKKVIAEVAQLIPEGYVDIIRRVTPGVTLWVVFYILSGFPCISSKWLGFAGFIVFLLESYATGLLLDAVADHCTRSFFIWYAWKDCLPDKSNNQGKSTSQAAELAVITTVLQLNSDEVVRPRCWRKWKMPGLLRTEVTQTNAMAAIVLPKLAAEGLLLRNLAFALLALLAIMGFACVAKISLGSQGYQHHPAWGYQHHPVWVVVLMGLGCLVCFCGWLYRAEREVIRTREWFRLAHRYEFREESERISASG